MHLGTKIFRSFILFLVGMLGSKAYASIPSIVHVVLVADESKLDQLGGNKTWLRACKALGKSLSLRTGPWGFGVVTAHDCAVVDVVPSELNDWTLLVTVNPERVNLDLYFAGIAKPIASTGFKAPEPKLDVLAKAEFTLSLGLDLLEQLPAISRVGKVVVKGGKSQLTIKNQKQFENLLPPPVDLLLYTLDFDSQTKIWQPHVVATASRTDSPTDKVITWNIDRHLPKGTEQLWFHDASGRNTHESMHAEVIQSIYDQIMAKNLASVVAGTVQEQFAGGFIGVRYGRSITTGQLVSGINLLSVLAELRGSPVNGLRFYYDQWPNVSAAAELDAIKFGGSRAVLGWSFGFGLGGVVDRIDFVPKLGRWSLALDYNVRNQGGAIQTVRFKTIGAVSAGLEIGLEKDIGPLMVRLWAADDVGSNPLLRGLSTRVDDIRVGADLFIKGTSLSPLGKRTNLTFLLFSLYENLSLRRKNAGDSGEVAIDSLNLQIAMVGGGLALSW